MKLSASHRRNRCCATAHFYFFPALFRDFLLCFSTMAQTRRRKVYSWLGWGAFFFSITWICLSSTVSQFENELSVLSCIRLLFLLLSLFLLDLWKPTFNLPYAPLYLFVLFLCCTLLLTLCLSVFVCVTVGHHLSRPLMDLFCSAALVRSGRGK